MSPETVRTDLNLKERFRNVYRIHELTTLLTKQAAGLGEISVNAAIAAGHTGTQSKVFSEIAKQIGVISALLLDSIERIDQFTGPLASQTLSSLITSAQRQKFFEAIELVEPGRNRSALQMVCRDLSGRISKFLEDSQVKIGCARVEKDHMKQIINRVWSIAISLRISASMAESGEQAFFLSIAEALEKMTGETAALVDALTEVIAAVDQSLSDSCWSSEGQLDAA